MTEVNEPGRANARALIAAGKVDKTSDWAFSAADGDALLGAGGADWTSYSKAHLGVDKSATDKTRARWKYSFMKDGKVYRSALTAIRQRASAQGDSSVYAAAGELLDNIDGKAKSSAAPGFEAKFTRFEFQFKDDGAGAEPKGTFEGYASTFNTEDDGGDAMLPGAFDATLAQHKQLGTMPKMLLNHGGMSSWLSSPSPADMLPIGKWTAMSPDDHGLHAKGRLIALDTETGKRTYEAMKEGELSDLSIGYIPRDFTRGQKPNEPRRSLKAVDLLEVSPVTFPMNRDANITTVKAALASFGVSDIREFEDALCDGGLSRRDAKTAVAVLKSWSQRDARDDLAGAPRDEASSDDFARLAALMRA